RRRGHGLRALRIPGRDPATGQHARPWVRLGVLEEKDRKAEYPTEFVRAFADAGWLGLVIPEAYGGAGLGVTEAVLMLEAICASGAGLSGASPVHFAVFPPMPIIRHGTEELRRRILPDLATGRPRLPLRLTRPKPGAGP